MKHVVHSVMRMLACIALAGAVNLSLAQSAPPVDPATQNSIDDLQVSQQGGSVIVKVTTRQPLQAVPASFGIANPARIAFDFPSSANGLGRMAQQVNQGDLRSINIVQVADRTRVVLNMNRNLPYETRIDGASLYITLAPQAPPTDSTAASAVLDRFSATPSSAGDVHGIRDISFRRGKNGEGRIIIELTDPNVGIDVRKQGENLVADFSKTSLPEHLQRRLDVTDFATPITTINTQAQGENTRLSIMPRGLWEHTAYQIDSQFVIEIKPIIEDPTKLVQGSRGGYQGEKISLNFQNVDVRNVLTVIADVSKQNFVVSEKVTGAVSLKLNDVPWDQVLNIVMDMANLAMRKDGNVIRVAPIAEFTAIEDQKSKLQDVVREPMHQEAFQINYHKAKTVGGLIAGMLTGAVAAAPGGAPGAAPAPAPAAAAGGTNTPRGSILIDDRSNKIFVTDTGEKLEKVRNMIRAIDVPVRQVIIEARIVEASSTFSKEFGVRMGLKDTKAQTTGYNLGAGGYRFGFGGAGSVPGVDTTANVNNFVNLPAGSVTGTINLSLFNSAKTNLLNLELTAAEADSRSKTVSNPRVLTADKQAATIESGTQIPYQSCTQTTGCTTAFIPAKLNLTVTPQITPDNRVIMDLDIHKDSQGPLTQQGQPIINTELIKTQVLVDNGGTIVIGGIYSQDESDGVDRIPFLGDLPYVGFMFKHTTKKENKQELLIFITPRIVADELTLR